MNRRKFIQKVGLFGVIALIGKSFFKASEPNLDVLEYAQMQIDAAIKNDKEDNPANGRELIIYVDGKPIGRTESLTGELKISKELAKKMDNIST